MKLLSRKIKIGFNATKLHINVLSDMIKNISEIDSIYEFEMTPTTITIKWRKDTLKKYYPARQVRAILRNFKIK